MNESPEDSELQPPPAAESSTNPEPTQPVEQAASLTIEMGAGYLLALAALGMIYVLMFLVGGELRNFAVTGLNVIPFTILVVLAYAADLKTGWRKALTVGYWTILTGTMALLNLLFVIAVMALPSLENFSQANPDASTAALKFPTREHVLRIVETILALIAALAVSVACFLPSVRRKAARFMDIDPQSLVHATALATVVATTIICVVPLLAVGEPPLLSLLQGNTALDFSNPNEQLRMMLYSLIWGVPASFVAVGYPIRRTFREARQRLALEWPSRLQVVVAIGAVAALLLLMHQFANGIEFLWKSQGWRMTDVEAIEVLFGFAAGPVGAIIVAVAAGLGEELVFRGVLQPRLGIVLPALMFASVHALQYDFDALIQVLLLGLILGLVRKWTNTTTVVFIHSGYDLALFLAKSGNG
jgi:membrane protease YdiL (CAAX protease family)